MKLKYDDIVKLAKYLEENCKQSPVFITTNHTNTVMIFDVTNTLGDKLTIHLYDEQYYQNPKIIKNEDL